MENFNFSEPADSLTHLKIEVFDKIGPKPQPWGKLSSRQYDWIWGMLVQSLSGITNTLDTYF